MREVVLANVDGARLVGTFHRPRERCSNVGILLFNAGYVPRDGHGGLSALACDQLARQGVPAFRFDLPMLGDSPGEVPDRTQDLFDMIYRGGFSHVAVALERQLRRRYDLEAMVLGGLCGGAITAVYAADQDPHGVRGLVLLEPEFSLPEPVHSETAHPTPPALPQRVWARMSRLGTRVFSYWGWMRLLTLESRYGRYLPVPRHAILRCVMQQQHLPAVTNLPLVAAWRRVVGHGIPVLAMTAEGKLHDLFFQQVNRRVIPPRQSVRITHVELPGTNHIFTTGGAIDGVTAHLAHWMERFA